MIRLGKETSLKHIVQHVEFGEAALRLVVERSAGSTWRVVAREIFRSGPSTRFIPMSPPSTRQNAKAAFKMIKKGSDPALGNVLSTRSGPVFVVQTSKVRLHQRMQPQPCKIADGPDW